MLTSLFIALASAVLGAGVTYLLGVPDRRLAAKAIQLQEQINHLEAERERREFFDRFSPRHEVIGMPPEAQFLCLAADDSFTAETIDYLNANNASVGSQRINKTDRRIHIPLVHEQLVKVMNLGPWTNPSDHSAHLNFRVQIKQGDFSKQIMVSAMVQPFYTNNTMYCRVTG